MRRESRWPTVMPTGARPLADPDTRKLVGWELEGFCYFPDLSVGEAQEMMDRISVEDKDGRLLPPVDRSVGWEGMGLGSR